MRKIAQFMQVIDRRVMQPISLVISDVDATLITPDHVITERSKQAVRLLRERGILFTIASSRPPRGLHSFVEQLALSEPFAAFNGGVIQRPDGETLVAHRLSREVGERVLNVVEKFELDLWVYCDHDWHVPRRTPFVDREENTSGFSPVIRTDIREVLDRAAKLVVVGEPALITEAEVMVLRAGGAEVSATKSKPRFIDITTAEAHKGEVVTQLSSLLNIPTAHIGVIGDGLNDVLMFERAGFSIAMGQAEESVRRAADVVTAANTEEGFAHAMEDYLLNAEAEQSKARGNRR
jgi:Cof subfamily protein (haloacid dehalogenase superfamily)